MADVTTSFFANASQAEAAIAKLEKKYDELENKLKQVSKTSKSQVDTAVTQIASWAAQYASVTGAATTAAGAIKFAAAAQADLNARANDTITKYDELIRKLRIQAGITAAQGGDAQQRLTRIASRTGTDFVTAQGASEELISQGFSAEAGTGGAAARLLETMKATNADPGQIRELAKAYAALLAATGQEKNTENLENVTRAVQRTFKGTPLQASDLVQLAPKVQGVSASVPWDEALAQFAVMREKSSPDVASTGLKIFWERLQTASGDKKSQEALTRMGLAPDQVDAIGEKPAQVLDRLAAGLEKLKPEERPVALKDLFGQEAMASASGLIRDRAKVQEFVALQRDEAGFQSDVQIGTSGAATAKGRFELQKEQYAMQSGSGDWEQRRMAAEAIRMRLGHGPTQMAVEAMFDNMIPWKNPDVRPEDVVAEFGSKRQRFISGEQYTRAKSMELQNLLPGGVSAEEFLKTAVDTASKDERSTAAQTALDAAAKQSDDVRTAVKDMVEATKEQTEVLREFLRNARKPARNAGGGE